MSAVAAIEYQELARELKGVKQELGSLRRLVRELAPFLEKKEKAEWVAIKVAAERCSITVRQMRHRIDRHDHLKRTTPGIGVQVNMTAYNQFYS
jgi:predicted transcriptional regulator